MPASRPYFFFARLAEVAGAFLNLTNGACLFWNR